MEFHLSNAIISLLDILRLVKISDIEDNDPKIDSKSIIENTGNDYNNLTHKTLMVVYQVCIDVLSDIWSCDDDTMLIKELYRLRWDLIDILSDEDMKQLDEIYHYLLDYMKTDKLFYQFRKIKFDENTPSDKYPEILAQYDAILAEHVVTIKSTCNELINKIESIIKKLEALLPLYCN